MALVLASTTLGALACGKGSSPSGGAGGSGFGGSGGSEPYDAGYDAASGPHATVRIADFARPMLLYLDVCVSTDALAPTTSWTGPVFRGTYASISTSTVSPYFDVLPGTRSVRFVLVDSPDCGQTLAGLPDFALAAPLDAGSRSTLLFVGTGFDAGGRPLELTTLTDETSPPDGGNSVRFVNAAQAEGALDIFAYAGFGMKQPCSVLYSNVPFAGVATATSLPGGGGPTDPNGYARLGSQNLYDLTFASLGYAVHGMPCTAAFAQLYSTDMFLGRGSWTVFIEDEGSHNVLCRDDGSSAPLCTAH